MQPYLLPYIGYFQLINAVDTFVIYDDVTYIKKGWINRNNILINGKANMFTFPIINASQNKLINEIEVAKDNKWQVNFLKTIEFNYKKAPHFHEVFPLLANILCYRTEFVSNLIVYSIQKINQYLSITTQIKISSQLADFSDFKAQRRIIEICKHQKADTYINPIGGLKLYDKQIFSEQNININFIKTNSIEYPQLKNDFIPWLSMIDVLMFNSIQEIKHHLQNYTLL